MLALLSLLCGSDFGIQQVRGWLCCARFHGQCDNATRIKAVVLGDKDTLLGSPMSNCFERMRYLEMARAVFYCVQMCTTKAGIPFWGGLGPVSVEISFFLAHARFP